MGVLCKKQIRERLEKRVDEHGQLVITPLLDEERIFDPNRSDADSIDLRLGNSFLLPRVPPLPYTHLSSVSNRSHQRIQVPFGKYLVLPAHQTVLGATVEFIRLPEDVCGQVLTKSSVARTFIVVETAPWIHPFYRGCLTLEIANVSNTPVILYPGRPICQLILMDLNGGSPAPTKLRGSYIAPVHPEAPEFANPEDDLSRIGVPETDIGQPGHE